ncbi:hypothetical protein K469DRAFT_561904 [Zopfia rhizophila CBS 207.26]|uniref:Allergen n=1 Tax=Zopfia rhizophila CBS 207.26 TaxID=1314779 RepID=A0A6A6EG43_9PEZI|nr:hypothetical protein K469DRAFT_561904 [Zopfia rhizophila CBS 207.26]
MAGHHDTTVHETVAPSVQYETVNPHQHESIKTAVDKEVHQDHYHHSVQSIHDREVLPEKRTHKVSAIEHRDFNHRDYEGTKRALGVEQARFKDERVVQDTTHTQSQEPIVQDEYVHQEAIQPVIQKEKIQPQVVHTTAPIHETLMLIVPPPLDHNRAKHHTISEFLPVSMSEYKSQGGVLGGREERYDGFEGEPRNVGGVLGSNKSSKYGSSPRMALPITIRSMVAIIHLMARVATITALVI